MQQWSEMSETVTKCYHCGTNCTGHIGYDEKPFCCEGCKTVYQLISDNGLEDYYNIEDHPGISMSGKDDDRFVYLDNEEVVNALYSYKDERKAMITLSLPDIHCSSCVWLLENLPLVNKNVLACSVNFVKKEASITFDHHHITLRKIAMILTGIGYSPLITASETHQNHKKTFSINIKLGIAGFCFGNVMLLSFPEYFGFQSFDDQYSTFFSYLILGLSIPSLYSASGYFVSAWASVKQKMISIDVPIALGILALFLRSFYEVVSQTGAGYFDSLTGLVFFLLIGKWFQGKTYDTLSFERDFNSYFPLAVTKISGETDEIIPIKEIKKGDVLRIRNQEIIPADSVLLENSTKVNYSFVTGEEQPVEIKMGEQIFAGGRQLGPPIMIKALKNVEQSYLTSLWERHNPETITSSSMLNQIGKYFTMVVLAIAFITALYWSYANPSNIWMTTTAVLIVACPCALALSVPFTFGNVMRILGNIGVYLKNAEIVSKFFSVSHIVFDKTGTLSHSGAGEMSYEGVTLTNEHKNLLFTLAGSSIHPYSVKIATHFQNAAKTLIQEFNEFPGKGMSCVYNGKKYKLGSSQWVLQEDFDHTSSVLFSEDEKIIGHFDFKPEYRKDLKAQIEILRNKFDLSLISGDNDKEKENLSEVFGEGTLLKFSQKPGDKLNYIEDLQKSGQKVMMMGDGLNDAPALMKSDLGISITDDIAVFTPSSDVIMDGKNISKMSQVLNFIKSSQIILGISILISFLYNVVGLSFAVTGNLTPLVAAILMPLSSVSVVAFASVAVYLMSVYYNVEK